MQRLLITGGAGFVGSSLALAFKKQYPQWDIFVMDNLKRRGSELNIPRLKNAGIAFYHGDIRNYEDFDELPTSTLVIEASAEPSVLAGLNGMPHYLINTNLNGTINALNYAKKNQAAFIFLSTSRVYPIKNIEKLNYVESDTRFELSNEQPFPGVNAQGISEMFPLTGSRSLYGATKLASELMIQEYEEFYGMKTVINRCGVLTGPWQMGKVDQGVVVLWMAKHYFKKELSYIGFNGTGKQVRDILHVDDLFTALLWQIENLDKISGSLYNLGGGREVSVSLKELTDICSRLTGNTIPIHSVKETRVADIPIYLTDNTAFRKASGWQPSKGVEETMAEIYHWMQENEKDLEMILA